MPGDDIWRAGAQVNVAADNHYDVWAAGALANVRGAVGHELHAAGAEVDVDTATRGRRLCGRRHRLGRRQLCQRPLRRRRPRRHRRHVAGALKAGGARVLVRPQTQVRGLTQLAGADVVFAGVSHGRTEIYGDTVQIDGHIAGDLLVRARSVTIGKTARIDGNVTFQSFNEPVIVQGAVIRGRQTMTLPHPQVSRFQAAQALFGLVLFSIAAGFMAGLVLLLVRRAFVERAVGRLRNRPGHSFGLGVLVFILVPLIAVLLMATVIGIPTALLLLLALPLLWLVGTVIAAFAMGDFLVNRVPRPRGFFGQLWQLIVGLVVLSVIGIIPYLGFLSWLAALLVGLGAFWQALQAPPPAPVPVRRGGRLSALSSHAENAAGSAACGAPRAAVSKAMAVVFDLANDPRPRHPEKARRPDSAQPPKPDWIRVKAPVSAGYQATRATSCAPTASSPCARRRAAPISASAGRRSTPPS